ncbi:hypothetical protein [Photorhabdus akhurstii]|uniref:hypothetical protein n=1 Tax=Photorhabdus akhurstii TaxID=171438 RepID=UPI00052C679F|nr:hypothetical protein KS18_20440 [Photorhabdus luminescens]PQQ33810.1 hypothetical protein C6H69_08915 [Photorhabdus luminescens]
MIYAKNISDNVIKVSMSKWSSEEGDDKYFDINPGEVSQWNRSDKRGFLMSVARKDSATLLYSIKSDGYIIIYNNSVENNGNRIDYLYSIPSA